MVLAKVSVTTCVIGSLLIIFFATIPPIYRKTGRALPATTWHHVIIGYGTNPNWPFGNIADSYRGCWPDRPDDSFVSGMSDFNGKCAWAEYAKRHGLSASAFNPDLLYDKKFDVGIRDAVLKIFWLYPVQSFLTFAYYKPLSILRTLQIFLHFGVPSSRCTTMFIICQAIVFAAFAVLNRCQLSVRVFRGLYVCCLLGTISASGLNVVAYSTPFTTLDLFFVVLVLAFLALASLFAATARSVWACNALGTSPLRSLFGGGGDSTA
jgi:hypothetical protein